MKYQHKLKRYGKVSTDKIGIINWEQGVDFQKKRDYKALHEWLRRNFEKPKYCELCSKFKKLQWANISQEYYCDKRDFFCLCKKCHLDFDHWCNYGFLSDRNQYDNNKTSDGDGLSVSTAL